MDRGSRLATLILLETIDDLLIVLPLPSSQGRGRDGQGSHRLRSSRRRIHFGETVAYSSLRLLVSPGERICSPIFSGTPANWTGKIRSWPGWLSDARAQVGYVGHVWSVTRGRHYGHGDEFRPGVAAAIRMWTQPQACETKSWKIRRFTIKKSTTQRIREADRELAFVTSFIVESVVDSASNRRRG